MGGGGEADDTDWGGVAAAAVWSGERVRAGAYRGFRTLRARLPFFALFRSAASVSPACCLQARCAVSTSVRPCPRCCCGNANRCACTRAATAKTPNKKQAPLPATPSSPVDRRRGRLERRGRMVVCVNRRTEARGACGAAARGRESTSVQRATKVSGPRRASVLSFSRSIDPHSDPFFRPCLGTQAVLSTHSLPFDRNAHSSPSPSQQCRACSSFPSTTLTTRSARARLCWTRL